MKKKTASPLESNTLNKVCKLETDNYSTRNAWIMTDGPTVTIMKQKSGESPTGEINIPKRDFNKLLAWYIKKQTIQP